MTTAETHQTSKQAFVRPQRARLGARLARRSGARLSGVYRRAKRPRLSLDKRITQVNVQIPSLRRSEPRRQPLK